MFTAMMKQLGQRAQFARIRALTSNFRLNTRGNVAVITAVAMLPMVAAIGCVIDYTDASMIKTKLQAAADAAALGTVSVNSSVVTTAKAMSQRRYRVGRLDICQRNFFNANLSTSPENLGYTSLTPTSTVTLTGTTMTAKVSFTANVPTYFLGVLGRSNDRRERFVDSELHASDLHQFLFDGRRLRLDEFAFDRPPNRRD